MGIAENHFVNIDFFLAFVFDNSITLRFYIVIAVREKKKINKLAEWLLHNNYKRKKMSPVVRVCRLETHSNKWEPIVIDKAFVTTFLIRIKFELHYLKIKYLELNIIHSQICFIKLRQVWHWKLLPGRWIPSCKLVREQTRDLRMRGW